LVGLGDNPLIATALGVLALGGVVYMVVTARRDVHAGRVAIAAALITLALGFASLTAVTRAEGFGVRSAGSERYIYLTAAAILPLIALGGELLARKRALLGVLPIVLLVWGLPANIDRFEHPSVISLGRKDPTTSVAHSAFIDQVPGRMRLLTFRGYEAGAPTASLLREAADDGRIPRPENDTPQSRLAADARIALQQRDDTHSADDCPSSRTQREVRLERNDVIRFAGVIRVVPLRDALRSTPLVFDSARGNSIVVAAGPLSAVVAAGRGGAAAICAVERLSDREARARLVLS
jgi:hypothetical protein